MNRDICCNLKLEWRPTGGYEHHVFQAKCKACHTDYHKRDTGTVRYVFVDFKDGFTCDTCGSTTTNAEVEYNVYNATKEKLLASQDLSGEVILKRHCDIIPYCPACEDKPVAKEIAVPKELFDSIINK